MKLLKYTSTVAAIALLAGCATTTPTPQGLTQADADAFIELRENYTGSTTAVADMPSSGNATYSGALLIRNQDDWTYTETHNPDLDTEVYTESAVLGQLVLDVDFSAGSVTGEATDFVEATWRHYAENDGWGWVNEEFLDVHDAASGTLTVSNGILSGNVFEADLDGELTSSGGTSVYDLGLEGDFDTVSTHADTLDVDVDGTINGTDSAYGQGILSQE